MPHKRTMSESCTNSRQRDLRIQRQLRKRLGCNFRKLAAMLDLDESTSRANILECAIAHIKALRTPKAEPDVPLD